MQPNLPTALKTVLLLYWCFVLTTVQAQTTADTRGVNTVSNAQAPDATGEIYAIITGVSKYPGITPLKYADKDAILFRDFLRSPAGGNVKPENILSLINDSAKAADFNVKAYSWLLRKQLKKGDRLYIYFSGHGDAMSEDLYFFLPYDCEPNKDDHNYLGTGNINLHTVKTLFVKPQVTKGVEVLLIMDACRTNELPGGKEGQQNFMNNFIAEQKMGDIILLSTGAGQVSVESPSIGNGHGLFTYYLIDGLAGAADKDSVTGDNDGKVSLGEISSYVKNQVKRIARTTFNTVQIPYYCCSEKDMSTIAKVDGPTFTAWENAKKIQQLSGDENLFASNMTRQGQRGGSNLADVDTTQVVIYNQFNDALKKDKLVGEFSAEMYYRLMAKNWPGSTITEDARYSLAAKFLNFCQQKINLFLAGKGLIHIMYLEKELSREKKDADNTGISEANDQLNKLKTLVTTGFDIASEMMAKAFELLKTEPALVESFIPKQDFLQTMAAYSDKKNKLSDVVQLCRKAINSDPSSASGYLLMGWIYQDMQQDSCEFYFRKAASIAPKWAYPMNGLGNFYISKNNKPEAIRYFKEAIRMDDLFANAYRNLGMTYLNKRMYDSAKYNFKKALDLDPCDSYANENYGSANAEYISPEYGTIYTDSVYFKIARKFFMKSIECDPSFASGYQKMATLYSRAHYEDSALAILQQCVDINPQNADSYRNRGNYLLKNRKDTLQAEADFKKAITLDPGNGDNYYALARLYRKQNNNKEKAIEVYTSALKQIGNNKELFNELGNTYFQAPTNFEKAIKYYRLAIDTDPYLAYVYFNMGKLYEAKEGIKDSAVFYYSKAVALDPDRFQKTNHTIADFYYDNKRYSEAKYYYVLSLSQPTSVRFRDTERLVRILVEEKNFTEAENVVKKYLDPDNDKILYTRLMSTISDAR